MKLKSYLRLASVWLMIPFMPAWKYWSIYWTAYVLVKYGWITDPDNTVQLEMVSSTAWVVFLLPIFLYTAYTIWKLKDELE